MYSNIVDFIKQTYQKDKVILHEPTFIGNEKKYVNECIDTTFVSSVGKFVDKFEDLTAEYTGAKKAIVCVNGTNALYLALLLVGVKQGDEIITQPLTFIATANSISYCNANPIFIDVDKETMGLSPKKLNEFLSKNTEIKNNACYNLKTRKKIAACVPMHTFGHPAKIDEIIDICNKYKIEVVEDAAESMGSTYKGKHTGTFGKLGILSFNGNKTITTGGGGMILTNDEELGKFAKHLTTQSKVPHPWEFNHDNIGYNYRMPNINAALGCAQIEKLDFFIEKKRLLATKYKEFFKNTSLQFFSEPENSFSNYWLNVVLLENREKRNEFLEFTNKNGVMTRPAWTLMNKLPMFQHCQTENIENAQWFEDRLVNIPSSVII
ncbi:MAG: aminotransferase DegT [Bacteroidetes bacterium GWF2_33_38]|nr:MAG: aminotransferase DegT [Bacteroidetes bacterium GWF2_33_38]OFY74655.1 MAG: aminotransferase DegT [Bacteroidetes bacterium RIFOXYA12_FULL_33_9]OFY91636.1 MAG: aminotransferase DegT [Bacteroidetes bacterium RIFOXYA2_FULL_33_7]HBX50605.1 LegC family aminotransferase [Bacteroidales bacterium]